MPIGTPIIVNGLLIGYSGNTGNVVPRPTASNPNAGEHLHLAKFINGAAQDPGFQGFSMQGGFVYDTGEDANNGKYVRIYAEGAYWVYCHLSQIVAVKNQVVTGPAGGRGAGITEEFVMNEAEAKNRWRTTLFREPENDDTWRLWVGKRVETWDNQVRTSQEWLTYNHIIKVGYPEAMRGLQQLQAQLTDAQAKAQVQTVIERCTVDLSALPTEDASWLVKFVSWLTKGKQ